MAKTSGGPPPPSTDLEAWRQAIANGRLPKYRLESIAAAFQDIGHLDKRVREDLARHLSGAITGMLVKRVGKNRPNEGRDIVLDVHDQIWEALLKPQSADGKQLRTKFGSTVIFRMKTAIANSLRDQVTPVPKTARKSKGEDTEEPLEEVEAAIDEATRILGGDLAADTEGKQANEDRAENPNGGKDESLPLYVVDEAEDDEIAPGKREHDPELLDGVRDADETIDFKRILSAIPGYKKQLAFYLYVHDVPAKSDLGYSIAKACDVSDRTIRTWIKEFEEQLQQNKEAQELLKLKVGAKS